MTRSATRARPRAGAAGLLLPVAEQIFGGPPPVRIRAWDGSEAGRDGGPVLVLRTRQALRRMMWHPGELGVAQAYVTGELDVEGDLIEGLRAVWRAGSVAGQAGWRGRPGCRPAPGPQRRGRRCSSASPGRRRNHRPRRPG